MNRLAVIFVALILFFLSPSLVTAAAHTIENQRLSVTYDDEANVFSVTDKASGLVFLKDGKLEGTPSRATAGPTTEHASDSLGSGRQIVVFRTDGGLTTLRLYERVPFVFISGQLCNNGKETMDVRSVTPATFTLDLGKPAGELCTMGTGGLAAPDKNPGSYLFLTLADPATRRGVVAGWLTSDRGSGVLFPEVKDDHVRFLARIDYGHLRIPPKDEKAIDSGGKTTDNQATATLETLMVGLFDDARIGEEQFADVLAKHHQIKLRPEISGHCTWYSDGPAFGGAADEKSLVELAEFAAKELKPFGFSFIQIDDHWQSGEEINGPRRGFDHARPDGPYPRGMKIAADKIDPLGLMLGIWFMPFACNHQTPEYKDHQHWFMKYQDGKPYETPWGGTSLDMTNPEVKSHVAALVKTIHSWGYDYFKMDGLWTGMAAQQVYVNDGYRDDKLGDNAPFHDPLKTNIEVFRDGLRLVREAAGPDVFLSGCNISQNMRTLGGAIGLVDAMRIGPDNGMQWGDYRKEIETTDGGHVVSGPIRGSRLYFLNGRVWWNDPDPYYVRDKIPLSDARLIASWVAVSGAFQLNSDWIPWLSVERLDILKRIMPAHGATARPIDYFDSILPSMWLVTDSRNAVRRDVLGLFNWETTEQTIGYSVAKAGLDPAKTYHAFDFWANQPAPSFSGQFSFQVPGHSCRVIAVRAADDHPVVVSTSRHISQGMIDLSDEQWRGSTDKGELTGTSHLIANDPYELRIAGLNDGGKWKLASVSVSPDDASAGVVIEPKTIPGEDGWLRVVISSKQTREVHWSVQFKRP